MQERLIREFAIPFLETAQGRQILQAGPILLLVVSPGSQPLLAVTTPSLAAAQVHRISEENKIPSSARVRALHLPTPHEIHFSGTERDRASQEHLAATTLIL